jgi:hypothetical protein
MDTEKSKVVSFFEKIPPFGIIVIGTGIAKFVSFFVNETFLIFINNYENLKGGPAVNFNSFESTSIAFFKGIIFAPLIETFFFQFVLFKILDNIKYLNGRLIFKIIIASLLFGLIHYYSIYYIILSFLTGITLNYIYTLPVKKSISNFAIVCIIHSLYNLLTFLVNVI